MGSPGLRYAATRRTRSSDQFRRHARAVFNDFIEAVDDRKQPPLSNPVRTRLFEAEPPGRNRYLTEDEEKRLQSALPASDDWSKAVVAMQTGLDRGAQFGLLWSDVDLATRTIHTERRKGRRRGSTVVRVPINDELLALFQALPSRLTSKWVFPNAAGDGPTNGREFDRLVFRPAFKRARIRGFRWKDLRHHLRDPAADAERRPAEHQRAARPHTTTRMTERYAHATPGHLLAAVQRISRPTVSSATDNGTDTPAE